MDRTRQLILAACTAPERAAWVRLFGEPFPATLAAPAPQWHQPPTVRAAKLRADAGRRDWEAHKVKRAAQKRRQRAAKAAA